MNINGIEFFEDLIEIHNAQISIADKYPKLRSLLERICKDLTAKESMQFSNLFSRLSYLCEKTNLDRWKTYQLHKLRINANKILHDDFTPTQEDYLQNLKALCLAINHFYGIDIPKSLTEILPKKDYYKPKQRQGKKYDRIRVEVSSTDQQYIYAFDEENPTEEPIKIKHSAQGVNKEFDTTVAKLWKGCQLNLIEVNVDESGIYLPEIIILEPDYLLDISSLAECMKEYGKHPLNYVQSKFEALRNTKYMLLGNIANVLLDEFVNEKQTAPVVYNEAMRKAFKSAAFEFSTCDEIDANFFQDTQIQFQNIKNIVNNTFPSKGIDRENALLEPNFICEHLGVQGRLDLLQLQSNSGKKFVIELKSGKAPYPEIDTTLIGLNHKSQAFLYQIIIQKILGIQFKDLHTYILYSKYTDPSANLRLSAPYMGAIKEILNVRNLIVANERSIVNDKYETQTRHIINSIEPENLVTSKALTDRFIANYIIPQINAFTSPFKNANKLELEYFHSFYSFVTKEHYISKAGDSDYENTKGISSLWLSSLSEKLEAGEILTDLTIVENLSETEIPSIKLEIPNYDHDFLPNFRQGDIVILYERNSPKDNVTNKQIFKASIAELSPTAITVRIRFKQRNQSVMPQSSKYAIERDFLDSSYNSMYRGLYAFLRANRDRKDLLLHQRQASQDNSQTLTNSYISKEIDEIILKAKQAKDYFLLIGPPGTGKTSIALKSMVEEFYSNSDNNILLISYTNRAVDEICDALDNVKDSPSYIRIGSELSCDPTHRKSLLEKVIENCENRNEVKARIRQHRIFVGTVASLSNKVELFKLKHFQVAIIDEASQILEPSLIGILSAKNSKKGNAIDKFILIGDHKQLPAVVQQSEEASMVTSERLRQIGLNDRKNSLFERLYNLHKSDKESPVWGMLHKQGRMHPDIALFPNYTFYNNRLEAVPTPHQGLDLEYGVFDNNNSFQKLIASSRVAFLPSEQHEADKTYKTNTYEAKIAKELVVHIYNLYSGNSLRFVADETVGIITPYRSQIALIKKEIHKLGIPALNNITIDTVERFQGSQRDIIIYSFSTNQYAQLDFLANNIEDEGKIIDRKLNVAITRAKKQIFIIGNPTILANNLLYYRFIEFIRSKSGYIMARPEDILKGNFIMEAPETDVEPGGNALEATPDFKAVFDKLVIGKIESDCRSQFPKTLYGSKSDYIRNNIIEYGRTNFDQATATHSPAEKVNLYCYFDMRKHYYSSIAIFKSFHDYFRTNFANCNNRVTFIDFGCGPLTAGLAFQQSFASTAHFHFDYVGIDISDAMLHKAKEFANSGLFNRDTRFQFTQSLRGISESYWQSVFTLPSLVVLNFSYLFGAITKHDTEKLANELNALLDKYPLNKYVLIFQNTAVEKQNRTYVIFKKLIPRLQNVTNNPKTEKITYKDATISNYDKTETVYYELLSS